MYLVLPPLPKHLLAESRTLTSTVESSGRNHVLPPLMPLIRKEAEGLLFEHVPGMLSLKNC